MKIDAIIHSTLCHFEQHKIPTTNYVISRLIIQLIHGLYYNHTNTVDTE
jgi:hypothetical protein